MALFRVTRRLRLFPGALGASCPMRTRRYREVREIALASNQTRLVTVPIDSIDANPFRQLGAYPFVERKLDALIRSIADVGLWEGIIGRQIGNRTQIAFGHHRVEAARRARLNKAPVIIRDLDDKEMLQFMGRENMEDYNADFLCMLETWEAGAAFRPARAGQGTHPIEIARLLGWTVSHTRRDADQLNDTARACNAAHALIAGGYLARADLTDLTVRSAREIVERAQSRMEQLDRLAKTRGTPVRETETAKRQIGMAVKETARQSRDGRVAPRDLRGTVDVNAYRFSRQSPRPSPLFDVFGKALGDSIAKMLNGDTAEAKLEEVRKALGSVTLDDDKRILSRLDFELGELGERTAIWRKRLTPADKKVTRLLSRGDDA